jgi:hypothetical protein
MVLATSSMLRLQQPRELGRLLPRTMRLVPALRGLRHGQACRRLAQPVRLF